MGFAFLVGDLNSLTTVDEVAFSKVEWTPTLNGSGKLSATLGANDPHVGQLVEWRTVIYVTDTAGRVWAAGVVVDSKWATGVYTFDCVMLPGYLGRRFVRADRTWTTQDQFAIVSDLVDIVEASSLGIGLTLRRWPDAASGINRTLVVKGSERKNVQQLVTDLAALSSGFDWDVTCEWDPTTPNKILRYLDVWFPGRGRALELVWEHGRTCALTGASRVGTNVADVYDAVGNNSGGTPTIASATVTRATGRPRLESVQSVSDQSTSAILTAAANTSAARDAVPVWAPEVTITGEGDTDPDGWQIGDSVVFVARSADAPAIEARHRIVQATYGVGEGALVVSGVQLSPILAGDPVRPPNYWADQARLARRVQALERR